MASFSAADAAGAPLRHLGALGFALFWVLAATGLYLYLRFDTSAEGAYRSIGELEWWFGGVLRSLHRYAADAFVVVVAAHVVRELWLGRFRGLRAFSWISGVPLVALLYASGIVGYWLVWDARAEFSYRATLEWLGAPAGAEAAPDRLFSLFVFLHIGLPLALLAGMWIHVQRLGRPATVAPRALAWGLVGALAVLALLAPATSAARWDPSRVAQGLGIDWFLQFAHPLMYATSPAALWGFVLTFILCLSLLPCTPAKPVTIPAKVDPENCNGCGRCIADCPYAAIQFAGGKAAVLAERCAACGICAGACPSSTPFRSARELVSGIDLPDFTVHALRRKLQELLLQSPGEITFQCERDPAKHSDAIGLRCLAMLPPSFIEYALRNGAQGVKAVGCGDECAYRLGLVLSEERWSGAREPRLRPTVKMTRHEHEFAFRLA